MSIIDSVKNLLGYETPILKVTMMGPRGSGKTTILTSVFSNAVEDFAPTQLYLRGKANSSGISTLVMRKAELTDIFARKGNLSGVTASSKEDVFNFEIGIKGKEPVANIDIKDFPGEYLVNRSSYVNQFIEESDIIMVAIDTPYLMEGDKGLNEEMNKTHLVTDYFSRNPDVVKNKLVLLVPLKCEKYFIGHMIQDVTNRVKETYAELFNIFRSNNIACAITPIQTLGGVVFDAFEDNYRGVGVSKIAKYRFTENNPKYKPMFCVQPLYYLLTYVAGYMEWQKTHRDGSLIEKVKRNLLNLLMSNAEFNQEIKNLQKFMLTETNGYEIVVRNSILSTN